MYTSRQKKVLLSLDSNFSTSIRLSTIATSLVTLPLQRRTLHSPLKAYLQTPHYGDLPAFDRSTTLRLCVQEGTPASRLSDVKLI